MDQHEIAHSGIRNTTYKNQWRSVALYIRTQCYLNASEEVGERTVGGWVRDGKCNRMGY
jgi:hypothetical protein